MLRAAYTVDVEVVTILIFRYLLTACGGHLSKIYTIFRYLLVIILDYSEYFCPDNWCEERERCIPEDWICDGEKDCPDGFDEPSTCGKHSNAIPVFSSSLKQTFRDLAL